MTNINTFDWLFYIKKYEDLQRANIDSEEKAYHHWITSGQKEGRICSHEKSVNSMNKPNLKIKYYAVSNNSGYAESGRAYIKMLRDNGVQIKFCDIFTNDQRHDDFSYNYVIIQLLPTSYRLICNFERRLNKNVKIFGLTMWESDMIPLQWASEINTLLDFLIVPSEWNKYVFSKHVRKPIYVVHQPISDIVVPEVKKNIMANIDKKDYVFYTIGQWNARKRIDILITVYLNTFTKDDNVVLFVKTFLRNYSIADKKILSSHIEKLIKKFPNPARVIYNLDLLDDAEMYMIHRRGNCFVSPCASEAIGLGACYAALMNNRVIITNYGGHLEYLKCVDLIKSEMIPAESCGYLPLNHNNCFGDICKHYPCYDPKLQKWARADSNHLKELMVDAYKKKLEGNMETKQYILDHFNSNKIYAEFKKIDEFSSF
ncbi:MAG: glycosyltransferase family 1 protein [Hyperionvirus sp.]|uniref:Glycosyltransferase family 1 protein n=1 Tax=Hyperionvirus sp. TaxID=2487770 RepID=A0A3G5A8C0_9VIRU|nr:MAG: glycosyltransferase family 1 protein [Hyperionvirus sp.]